MLHIGGVTLDGSGTGHKRCILMQAAGPCMAHVNSETCPQGVIRGASGKIQWDKCTGNSSRRSRGTTKKEPLTAR